MRAGVKEAAVVRDEWWTHQSSKRVSYVLLTYSGGVLATRQ